jgi:hypothetical protein
LPARHEEIAIVFATIVEPTRLWWLGRETKESPNSQISRSEVRGIEKAASPPSHPAE